jgi:hypothetical protein
MNLRRRRTEPVNVEYVFHNDDGSTEVETVEVADTVEETHDESASDDGAVATVRRPSLSALLVEAGLASDEQIRLALEEGDRTGEKLGEVVVRRGWASEGQLAQLLAQQWGLQAVDPGALSLDPLAVNRLEIGLAAQLGGFPVWFDTQGVVVAVAEPTEERFAAFREHLGNVSFVVVSRSTLHELAESRLFGAKGRDKASDPVPLDGTSGIETPTAEVVEGSHDAPSMNGHREEPVPELAGPVADMHDKATENAPVGGSLVERLRSIEVDLQDLEEALRASQALVEERDAELATVHVVREQDQARIRALEEELAERGRRLDALRSKVADLSLAFDD